MRCNGTSPPRRVGGGGGGEALRYGPQGQES